MFQRIYFARCNDCDWIGGERRLREKSLQDEDAHRAMYWFHDTDTEYGEVPTPQE